MPLLLPKTKGVRREANFSGRPLLTWGTTLTSDGTTNVEPATETELFASTSFDTDWVEIWFHTNSAAATDSDSLVNIKVGTAGNEITIIPDLLAGWVAAPGATASDTFRLYGFPLYIPSGTRISATHRSVRISTGVRCMMALYGGGRVNHWTGTAVEAVGADTANSSGTYVTPGTTSEGTITSIGTTAREWGFVQPMMGGNTDTTLLAGIETADICSGASTVINGLEDFMFETNTAESSMPMSGGRYCYIPTGTTLHLRTQFSGAAEAKAYVIYGVY